MGFNSAFKGLTSLLNQLPIHICVFKVSVIDSFKLPVLEPNGHIKTKLQSNVIKTEHSNVSNQ